MEMCITNLKVFIQYTIVFSTEKQSNILTNSNAVSHAVKITSVGPTILCVVDNN